MPETPDGLKRNTPRKKVSRQIDRNEMAGVFARTFRGVEGEMVLDHLREITIERRLDPETGEALLRHMEGQRFLTAYMEALVVRGRE